MLFNCDASTLSQGALMRLAVGVFEGHREHDVRISWMARKRDIHNRAECQNIGMNRVRSAIYNDLVIFFMFVVRHDEFLIQLWG